MNDDRIDKLIEGQRHLIAAVERVVRPVQRHEVLPPRPPPPPPPPPAPEPPSPWFIRPLRKLYSRRTKPIFARDRLYVDRMKAARGVDCKPIPERRRPGVLDGRDGR